jgi:outer membrane immunogenic protein
MKGLSVVATASLIAFALAGGANAADLGRPVYKAPPPSPPPVWSWTGFYIGVNAGGSIGRDPTSFSESGIGTVVTDALSPAGFIGGGQLGYNYQFAPNWVAGIEGDFQGASQKDSGCIGLCGGNPPIPSETLNITQKVEWFATLRARLGYTNGDWLWYVTGGGAWAQVHNDLVSSFFGVSGSANFDEADGRLVAVSRRTWAAIGPQSSNISIWISAALPIPYPLLHPVQ